MPQAFPISEQLSEVQCCYLASEEELASSFAVDGHLVDIVFVFQDRWYRFDAVSEPCKIFEFFGAHPDLHSCPFAHCLRNLDLADPFEHFRFAMGSVRTVYADISFK